MNKKLNSNPAANLRHGVLRFFLVCIATGLVPAVQAQTGDSSATVTIPMAPEPTTPIVLGAETTGTGSHQALVIQPLHLLNSGLELGYEAGHGQHSFRVLGAYARARRWTFGDYKKAKFEELKLELQYKYYFGDSYIGTYANYKRINMKRNQLSAESVGGGFMFNNYDYEPVNDAEKAAAATFGVLVGQHVQVAKKLSVDCYFGFGLLVPTKSYDYLVVHNSNNPYKYGGNITLGASINYDLKGRAKSPIFGKRHRNFTNDSTIEAGLAITIKPLAILVGGLELGIEKLWKNGSLAGSFGYYQSINTVYTYRPDFSLILVGEESRPEFTNSYYEGVRAEILASSYIGNRSMVGDFLQPYVGVFATFKHIKLQQHYRNYELKYNPNPLTEDTYVQVETYDKPIEANALSGGIMVGSKFFVLQRCYIDLFCGIGMVRSILTPEKNAKAVSLPIRSPYQNGVMVKTGLNLGFIF